MHSFVLKFGFFWQLRVEAMLLFFMPLLGLLVIAGGLSVLLEKIGFDRHIGRAKGKKREKLDDVQ